MRLRPYRHRSQQINLCSQRDRQSLGMLSVRQALGDNSAEPWQGLAPPEWFDSAVDLLSGPRIGASSAAFARGRFSGQSLRLEPLAIVTEGLLYSRIFCRFRLNWLERLVGFKYGAAHGYSLKHLGTPLFDRYFPSSLTSGGLLGGAPSMAHRPRHMRHLTPAGFNAASRGLGSTKPIAKLLMALCAIGF